MGHGAKKPVKKTFTVESSLASGKLDHDACARNPVLIMMKTWPGFKASRAESAVGEVGGRLRALPASCTLPGPRSIGQILTSEARHAELADSRRFRRREKNEVAELSPSTWEGRTKLLLFCVHFSPTLRLTLCKK